MEVLFLGFVFLLGLTAGSFLNVAILRGAEGKTLGGRSRCDSCGRVLSALELLPVISFVLQKGRCRHCGAVLSWQYPLVELGAAAGFVAGAMLFSGSWTIFLVLIGISAAIIIFVSDLRFKIIPNGAVLILILLGTAAVASRVWAEDRYWRAAYYDLAAAVIFAMIFGALWLFSRGKWMGLGDAKLIFPTSLLLGFPASLAAFLFAFWLGGIAGVLLIAFSRKTLKSRVPFGPFILAGGVMAYFFSQKFFAETGLILSLL